MKKGQIIADGAATSQGRTGAGPERAGRVHVLGRLQLRGRDHHLRTAGQERYLHLDPHRGVRHRNPRNQARERKSSPATFRTFRPRRWRTWTSTALSRLGRSSSRATSWSARCRPSRASELTPEEKLLHAIFGRSGEDVKNDSLEVPSGVEGIVIDTQRFSRRASMTEDEKKADRKERRDWKHELRQEDRRSVPGRSSGNWKKILDKKDLKDPQHRQAACRRTRTTRPSPSRQRLQDREPGRSLAGEPSRKGPRSMKRHGERIQIFVDERERKLNSLNRGDELPAAFSRWSRSTSPPSGRFRSATRWPAGTATRA